MTIDIKTLKKFYLLKSELISNYSKYIKDINVYLPFIKEFRNIYDQMDNSIKDKYKGLNIKANNIEMSYNNITDMYNQLLNEYEQYDKLLQTDPILKNMISGINLNMLSDYTINIIQYRVNNILGYKDKLNKYYEIMNKLYKDFKDFQDDLNSFKKYIQGEGIKYKIEQFGIGYLKYLSILKWVGIGIVGIYLFPYIKSIFPKPPKEK